jgi:transposase
MRRLEVKWKESEEELKKLYLKEKDAQNRARLQALWLLRKGHSIHEVAATLGYQPRRVQKWVAWYRKGGLEEVLRHRHGGRVCRLNEAQLAELKEKAAKGQFRRVQDAVEWVKGRYQVEYAQFGMYTLFWRMGLRLRRKRKPGKKRGSKHP